MVEKVTSLHLVTAKRLALGNLGEQNVQKLHPTSYNVYSSQDYFRILNIVACEATHNILTLSLQVPRPKLTSPFSRSVAEADR